MKPPVVANELIWWSASVNTSGKSNTPNGWNCDWEFKLCHVSISQTTWQIAFGFFDCSIDLRSTNYQVYFDISSFLHLSKNTFFSNQSNWAFQKCFLRNSIIMLQIFEEVDFEIKNVSARSSLRIPSRTSKSCLVLPIFHFPLFHFLSSNTSKYKRNVLKTSMKLHLCSIFYFSSKERFSCVHNHHLWFNFWCNS